MIDSHVIYKVKLDDENILSLKARITPHGNRDDMKDHLTKYCTTCPPTDLHIQESISSLKSCKAFRGDVKNAFLKSVDVSRDIYVESPRESEYRWTHLWLLFVAAYGLVNFNAKWQHRSNVKIIDMGLTLSKHVPQLFWKKKIISWFGYCLKFLNILWLLESTTPSTKIQRLILIAVYTKSFNR